MFVYVCFTFLVFCGFMLRKNIIYDFQVAHVKAKAHRSLSPHILWPEIFCELSVNGPLNGLHYVPISSFELMKHRAIFE